MYDWVQSSKMICLEAGDYSVKVLRLGEGTGRTRLDCLELRASPPPPIESPIAVILNARRD